VPKRPVLTAVTGRLQWPHLPKSSTLRIGLGFDAHRLVRARPLRLGGVLIPGSLGLAGHSDADVLLHALTDAVLGACALPDIGARFPDTDPALRGADSAELLKQVWRLVRRRHYRLINADMILICDRPRIGPHAGAIRELIAGLLGVKPEAIGLQAKTTEGTMLALKGRSIAALATVLLERS
jgi:2-C-methyl-D-erythritol 2,4-cyclodiphosphate synthase